MFEPVPKRKRAGVPEGFWEDIHRRREKYRERRAREMEAEYFQCRRCHWFKYCTAPFWKESDIGPPASHSPKCKNIDL